MMDRKKSVEKDERSRTAPNNVKPPKKVSPEKEEKRKVKNEKLREVKLASQKSPESHRLSTNKSPEPQRPTSPETRRGLSPQQTTPDQQRKPTRSSSKLSTSSSKGSLTGLIAQSATIRPSPSSVPTLRQETSRTPFVVKDTSVECDIFNRETLVMFLNEKLYSDLRLIGPDGCVHQCHRIVVGRGSLWIHRELLKCQDSPGPWEIRVPFPDPARVLPIVLKAMYTGQCEISSDSATAINTLARYLEVADLTKQVLEYLSSTVQRHNCVSMLRQAIELQADDVADACIHVVARNFSLLKEKEWNWLSYKLFLSLLQAEFFQAESEMDVYELIASYIRAHDQELTAEQKRKLQEETRYRFLSLAQMQTMQGKSTVPMELLLEGALAKLEVLERKDGSSMRLAETMKQHKRRQTHGLQFPFTPELEMRGIVHYLATSGGKDEYANPHLLSVLTVSASSLERGLMLDLVASEPNELWTRPVPASWFCVDFKNRRVRPHHYSLRHGGLHKTDFLRHWDLLGSNDGQSWTLLRRHTADNSLRAGFGVSTWDIVGCKTSYRYFRVIQTGHNSSRHNFLALSGFELYGELFAETDVVVEMK